MKLKLIRGSLGFYLMIVHGNGIMELLDGVNSINESEFYLDLIELELELDMSGLT